MTGHDAQCMLQQNILYTKLTPTIKHAPSETIIDIHWLLFLRIGIIKDKGYTIIN